MLVHAIAQHRAVFVKRSVEVPEPRFVSRSATLSEEEDPDVSVLWFMCFHSAAIMRHNYGVTHIQKYLKPTKSLSLTRHAPTNIPVHLRHLHLTFISTYHYRLLEEAANRGSVIQRRWHDVRRHVTLDATRLHAFLIVSRNPRAKLAVRPIRK